MIRYISDRAEKIKQEKVLLIYLGYVECFYDRMIKFIRSLFESALKTNSSLEFAVITGCLRISRESIFIGLNNLEIFFIERIA